MPAILGLVPATFSGRHVENHARGVVADLPYASRPRTEFELKPIGWNANKRCEQICHVLVCQKTAVCCFLHRSRLQQSQMHP